MSVVEQQQSTLQERRAQWGGGPGPTGETQEGTEVPRDTAAWSVQEAEGVGKLEGRLAGLDGGEADPTQDMKL